MNILILDFETKDPFLSTRINPITKEKPWKLGPGWAYEISNPTGRFKPLGCAVEGFSGGVSQFRRYITDWHELGAYVIQSDALVAHNALYDIGILKLLKIGYSDKLIYDTVLMANLFDNTEPSLHLNDLGKKYFGEQKTLDLLVEWAHTQHQFKDDKTAQAWAYTAMDLMQKQDPTRMATYALQDIHITKSLYLKYISEKALESIDWATYSDLIKGLIDSRAKGVRIDLQLARDISNKLKPTIARLAQSAFKLAGKEFNLNSTQQIAKICLERKLKVRKTEKGNLSVSGLWMEKQTDEFVVALSEYRRYNIAHKLFIEKFIKMQELILNKSTSEVKELRYGILHPEVKPLEARTGRFSSCNPNIQNIPSGDRDPELGTLCRSIFVPWDEETWYSLDFSNQEGRLALHYAALVKAPGVETLLEKFIADPRYDMHAGIAALIYDKPHNKVTKRERTVSKTIGLGFLYGMGLEKLGQSLGLTKEQAKDLKLRYNKYCPCFQYLFDYARNTLSAKGFITTIAGRQSRLPVSERDGTKDWKALNLLIQGSAFDQIARVIVWCYRNKIPILSTVHDEVNISCNDRQKVLALKNYMENGLSLKVPMTVDIHGGNSWSEAKYGR